MESLEYAWTGKFSENRCPQVLQFNLNGSLAHENIQLEAGKEYEAILTASDPDGDRIQFHWEIRTEVTEMSVGGDYEKSADILENLIVPNGEGKAILTAPKVVGDYRLFVYLKDGAKNAATANIPFYVIENQSNKQ